MRQAYTFYLSENNDELPDYGFGLESENYNQVVLLKEENPYQINKKELFEICVKQSELQGDDFSIVYKIKDKQLIFRGTKTASSTGLLFVIRSISDTMPDLTKEGEGSLNLPDYFKKLILQKFLIKGGLIIVSGRPGNGKSTTIAATIIERLKQYGGVAITLEDPIEYPMTGGIGKGICYQIPLNEDKGLDLYKGIKSALRMYPSGLSSTMLSVGEIRDAKSAALLLRESRAGHLCFTTLHANDVKTTIERIIDMASGEVSETLARETLAESLRMVIHQELVMGKPKLQILINPDSMTGISAKIRKGDLTGLVNDIRQQNNKLHRGVFFKEKE